MLRIADQAHETREADQPDVSRLQQIDDRAVVRDPVWMVSSVETERLDAGFARTQQAGRVRTIRNDDGNSRIELSGFDRVDDRLQV
jgi:hypothetical protein